jgi:hypothetical protein
MDSNKALHVQVADSKGNCVAGSFTPSATDLAITWITPSQDNQMTQNSWIMHVHNYGAKPYTIQSAEFSGVSINNSSSRAFPIQLAAGTHAIIPFRSQVALTRGDLFTAAVHATNSNGQQFAIANGGRVPDSRYTIEVWPKEGDCPFPSVNDKSWNELKSHGIDTAFMTDGDVVHSCHSSVGELIANQSDKEQFFMWTSPEGAREVPEDKKFYISAILLADENDGDANKEAHELLSKALQVSSEQPHILSYQGGKTNRHSGEFSGITDIQGIDIYVAACVPAIIDAIATLPLQAAYAYLRNTRNNHMPLPSVSYSQLYGNWKYEPNVQEILVQIGSVLLSGAKGMSLFQSWDKQFDLNRKDWDGPIKDLLLSVANPTVRHVLRTGDVESLPLRWSDSGNPIQSIRSLVEVIRNDNYIMVLLVNTNGSGYNYVLCHIGLSKHWNIRPHTVGKVEIDLGSDVDVSSIDSQNVQEASKGNIVKAGNLKASLQGNTFVLEQVELSDSSPVRILLIPYHFSKLQRYEETL